MNIFVDHRMIAILMIFRLASTSGLYADASGGISSPPSVSVSGTTAHSVSNGSTSNSSSGKTHRHHRKHAPSNEFDQTALSGVNGTASVPTHQTSGAINNMVGGPSNSPNTGAVGTFGPTVAGPVNGASADTTGGSQTGR